MKRPSAEGSRENKGKGFISGVLVLSLSTFIVKIIGLAYKIPMISLLGAEGMGYFNSAYEIYALLCVISTAGLPVALSILISADAESGRVRRIGRIYRTAMTVFAAIGGVGSLFMMLFARRLSELIENPDALGCIFAIAPALLFVCIASAVRGYFQGLCRMTPTAVSQLIEALGKLILGVSFADIAIDRGYGIPAASAFAVAGLSIGTLLSAVYLLILKAVDCGRSSALILKDYDESENKKGGIVGTLFKIAVPITLSSAVLGVTRVIDMALIMRRLQDIGYTSVGANSIYGSYTTLAVPVFGLIPSLITPISLALVPRLSSAIERGSAEAQSEVAGSSMRITVLFAMPASMGIAVYAKRILELLFSKQTEAIETAAPLLSLLGISILFSCLITTSNAILQSYRQTSKPIISMAFGALVKVVSAYILIGIPSVGVYGAPISTLLCNITVTAIDIYYINKCLPHTDSVASVYARPFFASCMMMAVSLSVYIPISSALENPTLGFILALCAAVAAYFIFALLFGAVTKKDILMLPFGERVAGVVEKLGFWRSRRNKT